MAISFDTVGMAFEFVSGAPPEMNYAYISRKTGQVYYVSGMGDSDELPDDFEESDDYVEVPHKDDLDLGKKLALDFVAKRVPEMADEVSRIFMSRGAYGRFKQLLESRNALQDWYAFEAERTESALRQWCAENGLDLT